MLGNDRLTWDHPRACGEHDRQRVDDCVIRGSSPRLRGTPEPKHGKTRVRGIIPALAGNTSLAVTFSRSRRDHPRACGEHGEQVTHAPSPVGSSPRLRGTLLRTLGLQLGQGIIPALAGNTATTPVASPLSRDHPRACGEHECFINSANGYWGSSPRLRGTPQ